MSEQEIEDFSKLLKQVADAAAAAEKAMDEARNEIHACTVRKLYLMWLKARPDFMARPRRETFSLN